MWANSIRVRNYKSYFDSQTIELSPSWNVIIGQNNAGKTALLECLTPRRFGHHAHRNFQQAKDYVRPERSEVDISIGLGGPEAKNLVIRSGAKFRLPVPHQATGKLEKYVNSFFARPAIKVKVLALGSNEGFSAGASPSHGLFDAETPAYAADLVVTPEKTITINGAPRNDGADSLPTLIRSTVDDNFFRFDAERFSLGHCAVGTATILNPNASNLASVLQILSGNPNLYTKFNENVSSIFPSVRWVSSIPIENNRCEVRIWTGPTESDRSDLAIPLSECGTGLGQVLSILYVAMTHPAGLIIIDEPNSFLHPGAAKKLIQILKLYDHHQYVISTHSPELLSVSQPAKLHIVRLVEGVSSVESFEDTTIDNQRMMLSEIGVSLSDVLSAERIIWVEGPTERECFDLLARSRFPDKLIGTSFVPVRNTGDLEGRERTARAVLDIYDQLSTGGAVLPVDVKFSFDSEGKNEKDLEELNRRCAGRATFLPRRMIENFLLVPEAISTTLVNLGETEVNAKMVSALIADLATKHLPESSIEVGSEQYFSSVDGARLLNDVFSDLTSARHEYRKVRDAAEILDCMIEMGHKDADELATYVARLLSQNSA